MQGMTKRERQITDENQIKAILDTASVLHLGMSVNDEPYVVPMNYGYTMENGKLVLYLHSALRGKKLDMIPQHSLLDIFKLAMRHSSQEAARPELSSVHSIKNRLQIILISTIRISREVLYET